MTFEVIDQDYNSWEYCVNVESIAPTLVPIFFDFDSNLYEIKSFRDDEFLKFYYVFLLVEEYDIQVLLIIRPEYDCNYDECPLDVEIYVNPQLTSQETRILKNLDKF